MRTGAVRVVVDVRQVVRLELASVVEGSIAGFCRRGEDDELFRSGAVRWDLRMRAM